MQQLAKAAMEREAYAEEVCLFSTTGLHLCLARFLCIQRVCTLNITAMQARQAGAVSRLTKVLANTGRVEISVILVPAVAATEKSVSSLAACSS